MQMADVPEVEIGKQKVNKSLALSVFHFQMPMANSTTPSCGFHPDTDSSTDTPSSSFSSASPFFNVTCADRVPGGDATIHIASTKLDDKFIQQLPSQVIR